MYPAATLSRGFDDGWDQQVTCWVPRSSPLLARAGQFHPCRDPLRTALPASPTDSEPVYLQRGNAHTNWHRLSILAAGPDTLVELQIAADHRDSGQHIWPVSDERRVLQRRS